MGLFDKKEIDPLYYSSIHGKLLVKNSGLNCFLDNTVQDLAEYFRITEIAEDTVIHFESSGAWDMHDLVAVFLNDKDPAKVYITTWAISEFAMRQLHHYLQEGKIAELSIVVDYRNKSRKPAELAFAQQFASRIALEKCHAKITVIELPGLVVTIVGSANYTRNPRLEAGTILFSPEVAAFRKETILRIINEFERRTNKGN